MPLLALLLLGAIACWYRVDTLADRMTHVDDFGFLLHTPLYNGPLGAGDFVSRSWTYAPGQFVAGYPIWSKVDSFRGAVFAGRLPSALLGTAGSLLFLAVIFLVRRRLGAVGWEGILTGTLAVVSMRLMIESQQGYPYVSTMPVAVLQLLWLIYCAGKYRPGIDAALRGIGGVLLIGTGGVWMNYQMAPMTAAACAGALLLAMSRFPAGHEETPSGGRFRAAPGAWASAALGLGALALSSFFLWSAYLKVLLETNRGVPSWAAFEMLTQKDSGGTVRYAAAMLRKFPDLFSVAALPVWPGILPKALVTACGLLLVAAAFYGVLRAWSAANRTLAICSAYGLACILGLFATHLKGTAPFGVTRHSFVLFVPVLAMLLSGEMMLCGSDPARKAESAARWRKAMLAAAGLSAGLFLLAFPAYQRVTDSRVDVAALQRISAERGAIAVIGLDWTWDAAIAQYATKKTAFSGLVGLEMKEGIQALEQVREGTVVFLSHRDDPLRAPRREEILASHPDWIIEKVVSLQPEGSTEPAGIINGGNGFFVTTLTKLAPPGGSCELLFSSGWPLKHTRDGAIWAFGSRGRGEMIIRSPLAAGLHFEAAVNAPKGGPLRMLINGEVRESFNVPGNVAVDIAAQPGINRIEWSMQQSEAEVLSGPPAFEFVNPRVNAGCTVLH